MYSAALKKCSEHCAFGTFFEEALRDPLVSGMRSRKIHKWLLAKKTLTWKAAVEIALVKEFPDEQANNFWNSPADSGIHYVRSLHPTSNKSKETMFLLWRGPHPTKITI